MQLIFLFPFVVLPLIFGIKIKFTFNNYLLIFLITAMMGAVLGLAVSDIIQADGYNRVIAFVIFYAFYIGAFATSLYTISRHILKEHIPDIFLAVNFGFFIMSFALISIFAFGYEDLYGIYQEVLGIQVLPKDLLSAVSDVSLIFGSGAFFVILSYFGNLFRGRNK